MKKQSHKIFTKPFLIALSFLFIFVAESQGQLANCKGKYVGNIIQSTPIRQNYKELCNEVSAESPCKWGEIEKTIELMNR